MEADEAKIKNIVYMAYGFSGMNRVFKPGERKKIMCQLEVSLPKIASSKDEQEFQERHDEFCCWFKDNITTAERTKNGETIKKSGDASYGQGAKVLDVAIGVCVYYCHLFDPEAIDQTVKWLNAAVDNEMMKHLKKMPDPEASSIRASSIADVDKETYIKIQYLVRKDISNNFSGSILPVQWDDIMWRKLNKKDESNQK